MIRPWPTSGRWTIIPVCDYMFCCLSPIVQCGVCRCEAGLQFLTEPSLVVPTLGQTTLTWPRLPPGPGCSSSQWTPGSGQLGSLPSSQPWSWAKRSRARPPLLPAVLSPTPGPGRKSSCIQKLVNHHCFIQCAWRSPMWAAAPAPRRPAPPAPPRTAPAPRCPLPHSD